MDQETTTVIEAFRVRTPWTTGKLSSHLGDPDYWRPVIERVIDEGLIRQARNGELVMSSEDVEARAEALSFLDSRTPMALESMKFAEAHEPAAPQQVETQIPPSPEKTEDPPKRRRTTAEVAADKLAKEAERAMTRLHTEALKLDTARTKAIDKKAAKLARAEVAAAAKIERARIQADAKLEAAHEKIRAAEGGLIELPAAVVRMPSGPPRVVHVGDSDAWAIIEMYLDDLCVDVEHAGYPLGHRDYELRTVQMGGEQAAIVFDALDPAQMQIVSLALSMAKRLHAHSAPADAIPLINSGVISWDELWAKMHDSVLDAKLTDPHMSGSDADALKALASDLLREYAVSPDAEKAKNELFAAMGCLTETKLTTPMSKNGWHRVNRFSEVMIRYSGCDVLDLAGVLRVLPPPPVPESVRLRERIFQDACARVHLDGMPLDHDHIKKQIDQTEKAKADSLANVMVLSDNRIVNPKSSDVIKLLPEIIPGLVLPLNRKSKKPSAAHDALDAVIREHTEETSPLAYHLLRQILAYRQADTKLSLLLRPLEILCSEGDGRMRPTVYTIEASTGRCSCRRPNGQQFSRQGGVRACVCADPGYLGISADFQGCEIRVGAALSGDRGLYEAEISPFCYKCQRDAYKHDPCGCGVDDKGELKAHTGLHWRTAHGAEKNATKEHRYQAKRGTFTRLFGGGADTAAAQVGCDVREMQKIFDSFNAQAPVFTAWDNDMRAWYKEGMMVGRDYQTGENWTLPIEGSQRMIYQTYSGRNVYITNGQHAAGNGAIQGTARELLVDGTLNWKRTQWGHNALLPIHDQLLTFVPEAEAEAASRILAQCMETRVLSSPGFEVLIGADMDRPFKSWPDSS